jgi:hypothetical protein
MDSVSCFEALVISFSPAFTSPTASAFKTLVGCWVQCLGRPTIRRLVAVCTEATKSASTYARFFRCSPWDFDFVSWVLIVKVLVPWFARVGKLLFACDDTTCDKHGKRVAFASMFRDALRSGSHSTVFVWAHCWVVMTMAIRLPLWRRRIHFPVMFRLYRKECDCDAEHPFRTRQQLALEMISKIANWLADRQIELVADGGYPCEEIVGKRPENVQFSSRMQSNAALYGQPGARAEHQRGRPREKGQRLPTPKQMAKHVRHCQKIKVWAYGQVRQVEVYSCRVLWWSVARARPILLVITRGLTEDGTPQFFFTTGLTASEVEVIETFAARYGIEEVFRDGKQLFGFGQVQAWTPRAVERQAPFALLVMSLVKAWYLHYEALVTKPEQLPPTSFMLLTLRMAYWEKRITEFSLSGRQKSKIIRAIYNALAVAG